MLFQRKMSDFLFFLNFRTNLFFKRQVSSVISSRHVALLIILPVLDFSLFCLLPQLIQYFRFYCRRTWGSSRQWSVPKLQQLDKCQCHAQWFCGSVTSGKQLLPRHISVWNICDSHRDTGIPVNSVCRTHKIQDLHQRSFRDMERWHAGRLSETWWDYSAIQCHGQGNTFWLWIEV